MSALNIHFSSFAQEEENYFNPKDKSSGYVYDSTDFAVLEKTLTTVEINYCILYLVSKSGMLFLEYHPNLFTRIRRHLGHKNSDIYR